MGNQHVRYIMKIEKALKNKDKFLERDSWAGLFTMYDKQGTGYITHSDLGRFVHAVFKTFPTDPPATEEEISQTAKCFALILDANKDGKVSFYEFTTGIHDIYTKFRVEQRSVEQIQLEHEQEQKRQEQARQYEELMYPVLKSHTDMLRNDQSVESLAKFLCNSKWYGSFIVDGIKQEYELCITSTSLEECTFSGYHIIGKEKASISGEFNLRLDWMLTEMSFQDSIGSCEAKFSLKDAVPSLNGPSKRLSDLSNVGAISLKYNRRLVDEK
jgi:hypothetical protein